MSYNFYSLVSSIKDKSSQAMATLSSDLKEFTSIVQEDVAEVAKTVRQTVHEKSEALRQRVEQEETDAEAVGTQKVGDDAHADQQAEKEATEEQVTTRKSSLFSFGGLSLEGVGSKILHTADELLGTLAGDAEEADGEEKSAEDEKLERARRYRLLALQEDSHTYVNPPMDVETFHKWRKALDSDEMQSLQEEVLAHYPTVAEKLKELVPDTVSAEDFWAHYIYKASLLAAQEQRGADLLEHALNDDEEEIGWDTESPTHAADGEPVARFEKEHHEEPVPILGALVPANLPVLQETAPASPVQSDDEEAPDSAITGDAISSDGESWIELDEARREAQQPPLSSSSTSSFVPVFTQQDGVYSASGPGAPTAGIANGTLLEDQVDNDNDDEDLDWGDDDDAVDSPPAPSVPAAADAPEFKKAADWGEWN